METTKQPKEEVRRAYSDGFVKGLFLLEIISETNRIPWVNPHDKGRNTATSDILESAQKIEETYQQIRELDKKYDTGTPDFLYESLEKFRKAHADFAMEHALGE